MKTKKEKLLAIFAKNPQASIEDAMRRTGASRPLAYRARTEARDQQIIQELTEEHLKNVDKQRSEHADKKAKVSREQLLREIKPGLNVLFGKDFGTRDERKESETIVDTLNARGEKYGPFIGHAEISRALKNVIRFYTVERKGSFQNIDADMAEALEMIAHKIARIINGDHNYADSWVDIAGYAKLVADRLQGVTR